MLGLLGNPRDSYDEKCREPTNPRIAGLVTVKDVGPFRARGLRPAVDSLAAVMADINAQQPAVFAALGTAGMLCARFVRGSTSAISNHSWGTAIDLTLDGVLDARGDGRVQQGLTQIAPIFNAHQWYWGAGFPIEDGMHFEASDQLMRKWHADGLLGAAGGPAPPAAAPPVLLSLGDRGPEVAALQHALNTRTSAGLVEDGDYGKLTHAAVMAFQAAEGLTVDGTAGLADPGAGSASPDRMAGRAHAACAGAGKLLQTPLPGRRQGDGGTTCVAIRRRGSDDRPPGRAPGRAHPSVPDRGHGRPAAAAVRGRQLARLARGARWRPAAAGPHRGSRA